MKRTRLEKYRRWYKRGVWEVIIMWLITMTSYIVYDQLKYIEHSYSIISLAASVVLFIFLFTAYVLLLFNTSLYKKEVKRHDKKL